MKKQCILVGMLAASLSATDALAQHQTPKEQPPQTIDASAPAGDLMLGTVKLPKGVTADGKPLPAGTYQVRLTGQEAGQPAVGITESLERWVEFVQGKEVKGREVVSIVPASEAKLVAKDAPPAANGVKIQTLKGNDYLRLWFNKGGNFYLVHLPTGAAGN
jgi:hypothetical protein